jgi:hypothetical protein
MTIPVPKPQLMPSKCPGTNHDASRWKAIK